MLCRVPIQLLILYLQSPPREPWECKTGCLPDIGSSRRIGLSAILWYIMPSLSKWKFHDFPEWSAATRLSRTVGQAGLCMGQPTNDSQSHHQLPKPSSAAGQGVLSALSLAGAHAAATLPLEGLLGTCRGKNTVLHRHTPRKGFFCYLARLLGTKCLNGVAIHHLSPLLVTSPTFPSLFCAFNQLCCENIGRGVLSWSPQPPDYILCLKQTFILSTDESQVTLLTRTLGYHSFSFSLSLSFFLSFSTFATSSQVSFRRH